jgi:hypothetical protein
MLKFRFNYWSCSRLADFIRGSKKPLALGWDDWDRWHLESKKKHPFRYWVAENGLKILQNIIYFPYDCYHTAEVYIRNRWIDKCHLLNTGLKPGPYYEFDYKVLYGLFNELSNYVEKELAALRLSRYDKSKKYKFVNGKCREAGTDHLDWAISLVYNEEYGIQKGEDDYGKPTPQALSAQKVKDLYLWWKDIRPNRIDPHDLYKGKNDFLKIEELEDKYEDEDTNKMIELIKIRRDIWT